MGVNTMTRQNEEKGKTTDQSTPVHDEQAKKPAKGELRDEELEKASGGGKRDHKPI
jgi:hypothetical protein